MRFVKVSPNPKITGPMAMNRSIRPSKQGLEVPSDFNIYLLPMEITADQRMYSTSIVPHVLIAELYTTICMYH